MSKTQQQSLQRILEKMARRIEAQETRLDALSNSLADQHKVNGQLWEMLDQTAAKLAESEERPARRSRKAQAASIHQ